MSIFDLKSSLERSRLRPQTGTRAPRSDRGQMRLDPRVRRALRRLLLGADRPAIQDIEARIGRFCKRHGVRPPSRATIYKFIASCPPHQYAITALPEHVRQALYNLAPDGTVPGHQLAFYAFQYGDLRAASFAAGLPWLDLIQADRMRGWRAHSHGLLRAALVHRGLA